MLTDHQYKLIRHWSKYCEQQASSSQLAKGSSPFALWAHAHIFSAASANIQQAMQT
jgi:hypothetical protein